MSRKRSEAMKTAEDKGAEDEEGLPNWYVVSLARGLKVLRAFSREAPAMKISEVARRTGMTRAAARRFMLTLVKEGYAGTDGDRFYLRAPVLEIGFAYLSSMSFIDLVQPILVDLARKFGESSSVAVLDDLDVLYLIRAPEFRTLGLNFSVNVGTRLPAYASALGRVLLAALPDDELERRLERITLEAFTPITTVDRVAFREELQRVREQGWAVAANQIGLGIGGIAVPIFNKSNETRAAVNIIRRIPHNAAEIDVTPFLDDLRLAAEQIGAVVEATNPVAFKNSW